MPYTVNSAADWARLTEIGVDGVITDRAGAFIGWKQAREQEVTLLPERELLGRFLQVHVVPSLGVNQKLPRRTTCVTRPAP